MKIYFTPKGVGKLHPISGKQRQLIKKTIINDLMKIGMAILTILITTSLQSSASPLEGPTANALKIKIELFSGDKNSPGELAANIVKGQVSNEKGEPIAGASILLKGTKTGTSADATGKFLH